MDNPDYYELRAIELITNARTTMVNYDENMKNAIMLLNLARMIRGEDEPKKD